MGTLRKIKGQDTPRDTSRKIGEVYAITAAFFERMFNRDTPRLGKRVAEFIVA